MGHQVLSLPAYMALKAISVTINQVLHLKLLYMEGAILAKVLFGGNKMSGSHCKNKAANSPTLCPLACV